MFKSLAAITLSLFAAAAMAAVDVNKADQAQLETVKGIGPALSGKILAERKTANFKDWPDFMERVTGIGPGNASRLSDAGLTVNGSTFTSGTAKPARTPSKAAEKTVATGQSRP